MTLARLLARLIAAKQGQRPGVAVTPSAAADAASAMEARLVTILQMVNGWLQYAEAKNAGLVALTAVGTSGVLAYLASERAISRLLLVGLLSTGLLLVMSLVTALISFLPRTDAAKLTTKNDEAPQAEDNLYFYGDLRKYRPEQLAEAIARFYDGIQDYDASRHRSHVDLASQIINNSRITFVKNSYFRAATWLVLLALALAVAFTVLTLLLCR